MKIYRWNTAMGSGLVPLLNAILAMGTLTVAVGLIGPAALADNSILAQLAISNPKPLIIQDLLKFASAVVAILLMLSLFKRLRDNSPRGMRWATLFGFLSILCLVLNATLSPFAISQARILAYGQSAISSPWNELFNQFRMSDLVISGFLHGLISLLGRVAIAINGLWYVLINWTALQTNQLPRGLAQLGVVIGALSLIPPLALLVLLLSIAWSLWLSRILLKRDTSRLATSLDKSTIEKKEQYGTKKLSQKVA